MKKNCFEVKTKFGREHLDTLCRILEGHEIKFEKREMEFASIIGSKHFDIVYSPSSETVEVYYNKPKHLKELKNCFLELRKEYS